MRFTNPHLHSALEEWRNSRDARDRSCADNIWFEERVSLARQGAFEDFVLGLDPPTPLAKSQTDYWNEFIKVDEDIPHTFLQELGPADLGPIDEAQSIVRLEGLERPLRKIQISFEELNNAVQNKHDPGERALLDSFLQTWNSSNVRDWRPAFAVFHDEVKEDLEKNDWPNWLRNRLGLAHYDSTQPIPVILMKYTVREVFAASQAAVAHCSFTAPTVFDGGPWPYFFPAPKEFNAGRTMALFEVADGKDLVSELLHLRIIYKSDHIFKLGQITEPPPNYPLTSLRNHHLTALRLESGRYDFGEEIV